MQNTKKVFLLEFYQDSVDEMMAIFHKLTIIADGIPCVRIKDPIAKEYALKYWDTNKDGDVSDDEAVIEKFIDGLSGNTDIVTFDEFYKFRYNNSSQPAWFKGCTALKSASLPSRADKPRTDIPNNSFYQCTSLEKVIMQDTINAIRREAFRECSSLKEFDFSTITLIDIGAFIGSGLKRIVLPKALVTLGASAFKDCTSLETVVMECKLANLSNEVFSGCSAMTALVLHQETPPTIGYRSLQGNNCMFYVPDNAVDVYKSASGWSSMPSRIRPMSEKPQ